VADLELEWLHRNLVDRYETSHQRVEDADQDRAVASVLCVARSSESMEVGAPVGELVVELDDGTPEGVTPLRFDVDLDDRLRRDKFSAGLGHDVASRERWCMDGLIMYARWITPYDDNYSSTKRYGCQYRYA